MTDRPTVPARPSRLRPLLVCLALAGSGGAALAEEMPWATSRDPRFAGSPQAAPAPAAPKAATAPPRPAAAPRKPAPAAAPPSPAAARKPAPAAPRPARARPAAARAPEPADPSTEVIVRGALPI